MSEGAESSRLAQGVGFGLMNAAWAVRAVIGPAAAGTIAGATGDAIPFVLAAASCVAALVFMRPSVGLPAALPSRASGSSSAG